MWPHERSLVRKLAGKPFALIGVNVNTSEPKILKKLMEKEELNWRSFADGGTIRQRWNLRATPTLYVLDHNGVIRHKWRGSPGAHAIDAALEKLIKEVEQDGWDKLKQNSSGPAGEGQDTGGPSANAEMESMTRSPRAITAVLS